MGGIYVFTLAEVPVWISPWYLLIVYFFSRSGATMPEKLAIAVAMTISLLAHEFGHALTAKRLNLHPKVLLHGMGGLCAHDRAQSNRDEAKIIAGGPLCGLALGLLAYGYQSVAGAPAHPGMQMFMRSLIWFNVIWSVFNLLPLWPMDGGQLYRLLMLRFLKPARAERVTHVTALVALALLAFVFTQVLSFGVFILLILGLMAFQNVRALREGTGQPVRTASKLAEELLRKAEDALARGDDQDAIRLCHQLRAESNVAEKTLGRAWQILGVATTRREEFREALSYLKRAPINREVVEALAQCFYQLDMIDELRQLVDSPAFKTLPADTRAQVLRALEKEEATA